MTLQEAAQFIEGLVPAVYHRFYGQPQNLGLGAGIICDRVMYSIYHPDSHTFISVRGLVYVLTHECDIDPANVRPFNDDVLICPIIKLESFLKHFSDAYPTEDLKAYIGNLVTHRVSQLIYLPGGGAFLPNGGIMYLNQITNTKVALVQTAPSQMVGAVSAPGLELIDLALENHLRRVKADRLWFGPPALS